MNGINPHHPAGQSKHLTRRSEYYALNSCENQALKDEVMIALDRLQELDQSKRDQSPGLGQVHVKSKGGRITESGSYRYRSEDVGPGYRDREGFWEQPTRQVLDSVIYTRSELGANGQPLRSVTLSLAGGVPDSSLLSKTVHDRQGKSIATGGSGRGTCEVHYYPGDRIDVAG